jgi:hypothetical protein
MRSARNIGQAPVVDLLKAILATRYPSERRRVRRLVKEQS